MFFRPYSEVIHESKESHSRYQCPAEFGLSKNFNIISKEGADITPIYQELINLFMARKKAVQASKNEPRLIFDWNPSPDEKESHRVLESNLKNAEDAYKEFMDRYKLEIVELGLPRWNGARLKV